MRPQRKWGNLRPGAVVREHMSIYNVSVDELEQYAAEEGREHENWTLKIENDTFCYEDCEILDKVFHNGKRYWIREMAEYWKELEAAL